MSKKKKYMVLMFNHGLILDFFALLFSFLVPPNVKHIRKTHISNSNSVDTITKQLN